MQWENLSELGVQANIALTHQTGLKILLIQIDHVFLISTGFQLFMGFLYSPVSSLNMVFHNSLSAGREVDVCKTTKIQPACREFLP